MSLGITNIFMVNLPVITKNRYEFISVFKE